MSADRKVTLIAGLLYILGMVAGILSSCSGSEYIAEEKS